MAQADALVTQAEQRLQLWFDANPAPPIDQINAATQAIWRITAVRKTLIILTDPKLRPRRREEFDLAFRELNRHMDTMERYLDTLTPAPKPAPSPENSQSPTPHSAFRIPHSDNPQFTLRPIVLPAFEPAPKPDTQSTPSSPDTPHSAFRIPHSTPCCPTLSSPLRTAQAAAAQADALCAASGLPVPPSDPTPTPTPTPTSSTFSTAEGALMDFPNLKSEILNLKFPGPGP